MTDEERIAEWQKTNKIKQFRVPEDEYRPYEGKLIPTGPKKRYDSWGRRIYNNHTTFNITPEDETTRDFGE